MAIGISPTVDLAFKLMLGSPKHAGVTIHFLNSILDGPKITQVQFLNPFQDKIYEEDKLSILDILATDEYGRRLNIEMQSSVTTELPQRLIFYNTRSYVNQLTEGALYTTLRSSINICVLTKPLFPSIPELHLDFRMREKSGVILTDDLQIHLLQLTNLRVLRENLSRASPVERWASFLRDAGTLTYAELCELFPEPEFIEAAGILEVIHQTPEQYHLYSSRMKFLLDEASRLESTRLDALKEGRQEGIQEGEKKGSLKVRIELIQRLQRLLKTPESTAEELSQHDEMQLIELSDQLLRQLQNRGS